MQLTFEHLSFSYKSSAQIKKIQKENAKVARRASCDELPEKADWGKSPDDIWAVSDVSFEVKPGDFLGIAGHTGSGKSTLTQLVCGLIQPTSGTVLLDGRPLSSKEFLHEVRGRIGMVFQYPEHQLFAPTVFDDVAFGPRNLGIEGDQLDLRVKEALQKMGLDCDEVGDRSPFDLSGGQQRRVALAGVLALQPEILVLDEPAAGLDPQAHEEMLLLVRDLHRQGTTVIMVSHNMDDLARLCTRILVLNKGGVFALDTPEKVFAQSAELRSVGLDVPAPQRMALDLRQLGMPLPEKLYDVESLADALAELLPHGLVPAASPLPDGRVGVGSPLPDGLPSVDAVFPCDEVQGALFGESPASSRDEVCHG